MRQNQPFSILPEIKKGAVVTAQWLNEITNAINRSNSGIRPPNPPVTDAIKKRLPQITSVSPVDGSAGDTVTITMPNAQAVKKVEFYNNSGNLNANFSVSSDGKSILAIVPVNFQSGPIKITTQAGFNWTQYPFQKVTPPAPPVITSALTASATVGLLFSYTITATNSPTSFSYNLNVGTNPSLNPVATFNYGSGALTLLFAGAGTQNVSVQALNSGGWGTATLVITVAAPANLVPVITSALTLSQSATDFTWTYTITATNSPTSFLFGTISSPGFTNLTINPSTGVLSWNGNSPWTPGIYVLQISASNAYGNGTANLTLTITP